jgi:uncharacterized protein (TIGR03437 family)
MPGQPGIGQNGVVNLASQIPTTLPSGPIAQGALFTIYGVRFGPADKTTVALSRNGPALPVKVVAVFPRRINALMPRSAPLGPSSLIVTVAGKPSRPFAVNVVASNPGIFSRNGEGWGPGRIENVDASGSRSANSTSNPARPAARATLVTTGLAKEISVVIGGRVTKAGPARATANPGEEEITVRIPADVPQGCYVPVYLLVSPARASNVVTVSIHAGAGPCDPAPLPVLGGERAGFAVLSRLRMRAIREGAPESVRDDARIAFTATVPHPTVTTSDLLPPPGSCTAYTSSYQITKTLADSISSIASAEGRGLEAGKTLTLSRENQNRSIARATEGYYRAHLGVQAYDDRHLGLPLFLDRGEFVLRGRGGSDIGPFTAAFSIPAPFEWTDREQTRVVDRIRGVTVHWKNASRDQLMFIVARNVDQITTSVGMCLCTARAEAGQFSIPPALLANVPATVDTAGIPYDELTVGAITAKAGIKAAGLNIGFAVSVYAVGRFVEYR